MSIRKEGTEIISRSLTPLPKNTIYVQHLRNFGDVLHSSMVVRHCRKVHPHNQIVWAMSERYAPSFTEYGLKLKVKILGLPHGGDPEDRVAWSRHAKTILSRVITPSVCPFGWNIGGHMIDNVLHNAKISRLAVPRLPFMPHTVDDRARAEKFLSDQGLRDKSFIVLEYISYTLSQPPHNTIWPHRRDINKYSTLVKKLKLPVLWLGGPKDPALSSGIDGRGIDWLASKIIIKRARAFVGCGSGLTVLACCDDVFTPIIEINIGTPLRAGVIYNRPNARAIKVNGPEEAARIINLGR